MVFGKRGLEGVKVAVVSEEFTAPGITVVPAIKVKEDVVIVRGSIVSLKVELISLFSATSVAVFTGSVEVTVGAVTFPVVKVQT